MAAPLRTDPRLFQFNLDPARRPAPAALNEKIHPRAWAAAGRCASLRNSAAKEAVRVLVLHASAGTSSDGAISVMEAGKAGFHWLVPGKDENEHGRLIWATCPERLAAWHVRNSCAHSEICDGATRLNRLSLGVEIVNRQDGADVFSSWQVEAAAQIVRYAWAKYPNLAHVVSHARLDPGRRSDPGPVFPWAEFCAMISA